MSETHGSQFPAPDNYTPVLRQYLEQRAKVGDAILLFRLGDFYESFFADAEVLAKELEITLTARADAAHPGGKVPMAGVPYRTAESSIAKLLKAGLKVAICEQMEDSDARGSAKGPMKRELTRILTPGTLTENEFLEGEKANYLATVFPERKSSTEEVRWGLAFVDISTGQLKLTELSENELALELAQIKPAELLVPSSRVKDEDGIYIEQLNLPEGLKEANYSVTKRPYNLFDLDSAQDKIKRQFGEHSLKGFGCANYTVGLQALGGMLEYLEFTYPESMVGLNHVQVYEINRYLKLDEQTVRNLEIFESLRGRTKKGSLLELFERETSTKIGARLLREWLTYPLLSLPDMSKRQAAVQRLLELSHFRSNLKDLLTQITDLERLTVKLQTGRLNPRELGWLKKSLLVLPGLKTLLNEIAAGHSQAEELLSLNYSDGLLLKARELDLALTDELPVTSNEGGIFKLGYSHKLDELKTIVEQNENWVTNYEAQERDKSGIRALKVCFNKAAGFYIELTKANRGSVPAGYKIKQNLTNVDRYLTEELKEHEGKFVMAESSLKQTEYELFSFLRESLASYSDELKTLAGRIAAIDCLIAFSELASNYGYVCPQLEDSLNLEIVNGRHPVIERMLPNGHFVGNDLSLTGNLGALANGQQQIIILTGPNMSGKSTFMKQSALICLMAQIGSFVPADRAKLGILDRIFTRIGASDDLSLGQSTFMVEMTETAYLLNNMTARSLILLDEIGRGTSTYDGVAIAWAVVEYIAKQGPRTIFATHYHELNGLADLFKGIVNYQVSAHEENGELILLHKVMPGGADKSYGIEVARMAGLPKQVLNRAQGIMTQMSSKDMPSKRRNMVKESIEQAKLDFGTDLANGSKSLEANV
jgi:DNA mismatch repair protein MutS